VYERASYAARVRRAVSARVRASAVAEELLAAAGSMSERRRR
jgi:hypothetical protein